VRADTTRPSLLDRLRDRADEAAWREFDARYGELIRRYCSQRGLQAWDADDVHQIVLMSLSRAVRRGFRYRHGLGRFRGYLGRMVQNAIINYRSRPSAAPAPVEDDVLAALAAGGGDASDAAWEEEWIDHHLRTALARVREVASARHVEAFDHLLAGASVREVAGRMAMSEQAVYKVKQRVRDRLRELVLEQLREEDGLG